MALIPIYWWNKEVHNFKISQDSFRKQPWANGVILLACVVVAMLLANLPFTKEYYHNFLHTELTIHVASPDGVVDWFFPHGMTMEKFINDILMVIFFFTVGLEIKREVVCGELSSFKKAILPVIAAFGGVVVPALIYTIVNHGSLAASGWGIPTATDIAFAVGILSILGDKVPISLKVFLTALAIADDLIAILVVALFYGGNINLPLLAVALVVVLFVALMKRLGEKRLVYYFVPAILVWFLFYYSGIHATMTGVVMAMFIPMEARYNKAKFHRRSKILWESLVESEGVVTPEPFPNGPQRHYLRAMRKTINGSMNMSYILERALNPWVNYLIMPLFALANAGVYLGGGAGLGAVATGIMLGLIVGKPLGITLFSWIAIKLGIGEKPEGASWLMFLAVACLGGIGFTMSIFVDTLSFGGQDPAITEALRSEGKIAVLLGSVCSAVLGTIFISIVDKIRK